MVEMVKASFVPMPHQDSLLYHEYCCLPLGIRGQRALFCRSVLRRVLDTKDLTFLNAQPLNSRAPESVFLAHRHQ